MHPKESNFGTFKQLWPRSGKLCCTKLYNHNDQPLLSYKNLGCLTSANFSGLCCWYTWKSANIAGQIHRLSDALRFWLLVSGIRTNLLGTQRGGKQVDSGQPYTSRTRSQCKQTKFSVKHVVVRCANKIKICRLSAMRIVCLQTRGSKIWNSSSAWGWPVGRIVQAEAARSALYSGCLEMSSAERMLW